jgi:hypothetical protein
LCQQRLVVLVPNLMLRLLLATAVLLAAGACYEATPATPGSTTLLGVASRDAYLDGLGRRDAAAIAKLAPPTVDPTRDIAAALGRYGGLRFADKTTTYLDEFGGSYARRIILGGRACPPEDAVCNGLSAAIPSRLAVAPSASRG